MVAVADPPEILAFDFGKPVLDEGDFAHVTCVVTRGDLPLTIRWSAHGHDVTAQADDVITVQAGPRASMLSIASVGHRHRGVYTCTAANDAGAVSWATELNVNGTVARKCLNNLGYTLNLEDIGRHNES